MDQQIATIKSTEMEVESTMSLVKALMKTPHYAKLTEVGMFAITQKAKSIGMDYMDALNGSMFFVNGKVELSGAAMNSLIRSKGHSIQKDSRSTSDCCILRGKRADNGDIMTCSFSLSEAKRAGLTGTVWQKYQEDMLFWRALSRLARQLFPDVIKGCYVQGEIQDDFLQKETPNKTPTVLPALHITDEQADTLKLLLEETEEQFQHDVEGWLEKQGIHKDFSNFPVQMYERLYNSAKNKKKTIEIGA